MWDRSLIEAVHQSSQFSSRLLKENDRLKEENVNIKHQNCIFMNWYLSLDYNSKKDFDKTYGNPILKVHS